METLPLMMKTDNQSSVQNDPSVLMLNMQLEE
jgi:hypothetical protein